VRRSRWICIGNFLHPHLIYWGGGSTIPNAYWMNWKGRVDWCQPNEFASFQGLLGVVTARLRMAGLRLEEHQLGETWCGYTRLYVRVSRLKAL
jgi:hypothetical protein